jgi:FKBP-type peptidyl-prolyl cis-trans isomerase
MLIFAAALLQAASPAVSPAVRVTPSGLHFEILRPGTGRRPAAGDAVRVTYEGRLADGTLFESAAEPVGLRVSDLVPGFTEALLLMNQGGRYRFRIPPGLAYGARGYGRLIPPGAELVFTLDLIRVGRPAAR